MLGGVTHLVVLQERNCRSVVSQSVITIAFVASVGPVLPLLAVVHCLPILIINDLEWEILN